MATPSAHSTMTASKHPHTPAATAPTPRSVPSPATSRAHGAAHRQTPHGSTPGSTSTSRFAPGVSLTSVGTAGGAPTPASGATPMVPSLSQLSAGSYARGLGMGLARTGSSIGPGAASGQHGPTSGAGSGLLGKFGVGLGLEGLTPDTAAATMGMGLTLSDMGLSGPRAGSAVGGAQSAGAVGGVKRDDEAVRKARLRGVLERVSAREPTPQDTEGGSVAGKKRGRHTGTGRISDEGVRRVARRAGFDVEIETRYLGREHEGNRPIMVAGKNAVVMDLAFKQHVIDKVQVTFSSEDEAVAAHAESAAAVLRRDLSRSTSGEEMLETRLDGFADNLDRLVQWDRLSAENANCVDAVTGLWQSFRKIWEHETHGQDGQDRTRAERKVAEKKSGRPGMHVGGRIGLSVAYLSARGRRSQHSPRSQRNNHTLELTVEASDPTAFPSMRISKDWISSAIVKEQTAKSDTIGQDDATDAILDWQEPAMTTISPAVTDTADEIMLDVAVPRLLPVRFVAKFHPQIVVPYTVAAQVMQLAGMTVMPEVPNPTTFEAALLDLPTGASEGYSDRPKVVTSRSVLAAPSEDRQVEVTHRSSLYVPKQDFAYELQNLPFSHPRQVVQMLPILRQWAFVGLLLETSFAEPDKTASEQGINEDPAGRFGLPVPTQMPNGKKIGLDSLLGIVPKETAPLTKDEVVIDVTLQTTLQHPTLAVYFPLGLTEEQRLANVVVEVRPNADIVVVSQDIVGETDVKPNTDSMDVDGASTGSEKAIRDMAMALELTADLGLWVEWIRSRHS